MILEAKDISPEFAETFLDKVHLAMSKIDPNWQEEAMTLSDSTETIAKITKLKIQGYKWVLNSSGKGFDDSAKSRLSEELGKLGEEAIPLFLNPGSRGEIPHVNDTKHKGGGTVPPPDEATEEIPQLGKIQKSKLPTQAQLDAGNYKKKHCRIHGLDIAIENPKNSYRSGIDPQGKSWKCKIYYDYGYIKKTKGADGDHLDVFIGPNKNSEILFIVNQVDPKSQDFDEHKVMIGFTSEEEAKNGYLKNYEKNWKGLGSITPLTIDQFKNWLEKGNQKRELIDPEIEFLKSDLARLIKKNNEDILILKSQLALQPITVHGKHGTYIQMRKVKVGEDNKEPSQGFQLQAEEYKKPKQKRFQERPKYKIKPDDSQPLNLITNIKNILLNNGQIEKAREFTELAYIAETVQDVYDIADDYVELEGKRARHRFTEDDELDLFKGIDYSKLQPKKILDKLGRWTTVFVRTLPFVDERRKKQLQEFKSVIQKYRNTPLWMKAPNGEPTNLSKKEWIKSRTASFKSKYGDWEGLALKRYLMDSDPIGFTQKGIISIKNPKKAITECVQWFISKYGNSINIKREDIGEVFLTKNGLESSLRKNLYSNKIDSIPLLLPAIKKGRVIDVSIQDGNENLLNYHLVAPISISGNRINLMVRLQGDVNGKRFYAHEIVINKIGDDSFQSPAKLSRSKPQTESAPTNFNRGKDKYFVNKKQSTDKPSTYRNILNALSIDPNTIKITLFPNGEPDMKFQSIIKSSVNLAKKRHRISSEVVIVMKGGKRRDDGETWTQPSGRKVTKKNGKILPVSEGRKKKSGDSEGKKSLSLGDGKEVTKVIKDGFDHTKLKPGFQFNSGGKRYEVIREAKKRPDGKFEAIFKQIESGGKIGELPSKALEESSKGGFSDTASRVADAVKKAKEKKSEEQEEQTEFNEPKEQANARPERGIDVPSSLPATQIRRATQYTDEKDYDKETINSLKERILENGYDPAFPIMVDKRDGQWTVVAGHHRHTAVEQLIQEGKLPQNFKIPVVTKEFSSDNDRLAAQVSENQRRNVLPTDEAKAYGQMAQNGWDVKKIAEKLGKKPGDINKRLALNNLDPDLFNLVKKKDKALPLGVAETIGMNAKDANGNPSHSMQIRAFKWFVENRSKYPGRGPSVVQSYIKELQSGELQGMDFDSVASDAQKEALRTLGSAEKAHTNKKMIDGMLDSLTKAYQRILGENINDLNPQTIKELAASLTLTGGSVGGSPVLGKLDAVIQDLSMIKDRISMKMKEIEADSQTPMMFGMAKSTLMQTEKLINVFKEEREMMINIQKGKVA